MATSFLDKNANIGFIVQHWIVYLLAVKYKWTYRSKMLTDIQCRMARAALKWSVRDLAAKAGVGYGTIVRIEGGKPANAATLTVIRQAFEKAGVQFTDDGGMAPPPKKGEAE